MLKKSVLEDLPDEILIEICLYLNTFDILYSFGRLNKRLQCTIDEFRSQINLCLFSLNEFQRFYSPFLFNFICTRLSKLSLSNEYAPGQIELFENLIGVECFKEKLPHLKSLTLIEFTNANLTILSKILYIKELTIEFNSYEKLTTKTENLINLYLFGTQNNFEKLSLYISHGIQIQPQIDVNTHLIELSIQVNTIDDLLILFTIVPYLIILEIDIIRKSPFVFLDKTKMPKNLNELYLHTNDKEIMMPFQLIFKPLICNLSAIEYLSFGIRTNDPDYADAFLWNELIESLPNLKTCIFGLEINITRDLMRQFHVETNDQLKRVVFDAFYQNLPSFSIIIYTNRQALFIDSIPYRFNRNQSYSTSPEAVRALNTDTNATRLSPRGIIGLSMNGEHVPFVINDYLYIIHRFQNIKWLYLDSINIQDDDLIPPIALKLKYFKSLFYMRSTLCKVNRTFFDKLFYGHERLDTLKIMYGDLIYLLRKTSPKINGNHMKYLVVLCSGADGCIRLHHLNYFISTFPFLEHLGIEITSSKLIKKNQLEIINELIKSFEKLRSFRIVCQRGHFEFVCSLIEDEQMKFKWLDYINARGSHLILQPKYLSLWKSHYQTTYF